MYTDPATGLKKNGIATVKYTHDAMIDVMISQPGIKQIDLAAMFDRTPSWVSLVINSDAFQARLAERRAELIDPAILATVDERLRAAAATSLDILNQRLEQVQRFPTKADDDFVLEAASMATKALGYGARPAGAGANATAQVAVVVQVPGKIPSATDWVAAHAPAGV